MGTDKNIKINEATNYYVNKITELETFPSSTIRIMQLLNNSNTDIRELELTIGSDPVIVSRLLKLVNSVAFKGIGEVNNIKEAILRIGSNNLKELVTADLYKEVIKENKSILSDDDDFSFKLLWSHSLTVAILSKIIAKLIFKTSGESEFMTGILHDIGLLIELITSPDIMEEMIKDWSADKKNNDFLDFEMKYLNTNHCLIGARLCNMWNLSSEASYAIKNHHSSMLKTDAQKTLQLANYIADRKRFSAILQGKARLNSSLIRLVKEHSDKLKGLDGVLRKEMDKVMDLYRI